MKIAICLHGYFNNRMDPDAGDNGFKYIKDNIVKDNEVDFFVHSWEPDMEEHIRKLYNPVSAIFEPQIDFSDKVDDDYFNEGFNKKATMYANCTSHNTLSFLYSRAQSIKLKGGTEYDCVVACRFDLGQRGKECAHMFKYNVAEIRFDENADMDKLHSSMWDQLNAGYADQWFYSSSENMDMLATAYEKAITYLAPGSEYEKAITEGWPDSKHFNVHSPTDPRQFSNELLKSEHCNELMTYPKWRCIDNHLFYKWFCIDTGLYEISEFV